MTKQLKLILVIVILIAGFLRFFNLGAHDVITDEVFYGYRSIGLIDSLNSPFQPTPWEWSEKIPFWAKLSFHDHPPLGFWIQNIFFKLFGVSIVAMRLPFALAGVASVWLVFLIGSRLFRSEKTGVAASILLTVSNYHIWISRIGLQEALLIFFLLLTVWLYLKFLEDERFFYPTVIVLGLAILMKYTAVILLLILGIDLFWNKRRITDKKKIAYASALFLVIISPILIYNLGLYMTRGHFDFQLSYLLGQNVTEWEVRPGRDVGTLWDKFLNLFTRFWKNSGPIFSTLSLLALFWAVSKRKDEGIRFLFLSIVVTTALLLVVGPQERFISLLIPFFCILLGRIFVSFASKKYLWYVFLFFLVTLELIYSLNSNFLLKPVGAEGVHVSYLRRESNFWGYNELNNFIEQKIAGFYPKESFTLRFEYAKKLQEKATNQAEKEGKSPKMILFVYDSGMHGPASLWYITRRTVYEGWPFISEDSYLNLIKDDSLFFKRQGFENVVFIRADHSSIRPDQDSMTAQELENLLENLNVKPVYIKNRANNPAFKVYEYSSGVF